MHPVLLHGFTGSSASWGEALVDGLASAGLAPVLVDLPGHGRAAGAPPEAFELNAVLDAVDAALGPEPAPLVGYSMGGRIALAFAAERPHRVSHLVLESASAGLRYPGERAARRRSDEELARFIETEGVDAFVRRWEALPLFETQGALPEAVRRRHRGLRLENSATGLARALRHLGTGVLPSQWDALPALRVPTLLVVGAEDRKFVEINRSIVQAMPEGSLVRVPGAGHTVHLERPREWLQAVVGFLRS